MADEPLRNVSVERRVLAGGMEASEVALLTIRYCDRLGRSKLVRLVVKRLHGRAAREAALYERLVSAHAGDIAPRLLAVVPAEREAVLLVIEAIRRVRSWPWADLSVGRELLGRLAKFHIAAAGAATAIPEWDYEAALCTAAEATRTAIDQCRLHPDLSVFTRDLRSLDRLVLAQPHLRRQLMSEHPFGCRPIHGDLHSGNVLVCRRGRRVEPVLLDWGRARLGSPFEDVSSWLQSLRYWEPEALRYHDTLLATYLSALGVEGKLTSQVRGAYWLAGASNALAGALLYHLSVAKDHARSRAQRGMAVRAARDWLRVIRRAHAWWS
ncbi:MAG TPA: phosphotransferase [Azospirillum sp.]|nr:phosphotransferase [Azospirillum sp.]